MAGIYVHIPFCKTRCAYCAFFSTTALPMRSRYVTALIKEYALRSDYLPKAETVRTIYLGGGTPSQISKSDLARLLQALPVKQAEEITIEANPSDITARRLRAWREMGINRLSMGIQSFNDAALSFLHRRHNSRRAQAAIRMAQEAGFNNISIDLMYALPGQTYEQWQTDIETALSMGVQHISSYCLSIEPGTALWRQRVKGRVQDADDDLANEMYACLCQRSQDAGYTHYEVSNFALPGYVSKHNSSYWDGTLYLGLGAGAHSYNGTSRQWNVANLPKYLSSIHDGKVPCKREMLTVTDRYNEQVMLGLRTCQGIAATDELMHKAQPYIHSGKLRLTNGQLIATQEGINILNTIITDLMRE